MAENNRNIALILLVLALFTGATIEFSEGSTSAGVVLILIASLVITQIELSKKEHVENSKIYVALGLVMVIADIIYNIKALNKLGTLDSMVFFLGISLIAYGSGKPQLRHIGEFGIYISSVFLFLFIIFYSTFGAMGIEFLHVFDHYFVLLPTVSIIQLTGIPLEVIATETVYLKGVEEMTIIIGGPCSGLYSMFLLIGIVVGYSRIEKMSLSRTGYLLGFSIAVAYLANLVRVIILYVTAYKYGQAAMMLVHTHIGWIIFALVAGLIMYIMDSKRIIKKPGNKD